MSFFKDFKDDLSQAVNELMPEESAATAAPQMVDTISEPVAQPSQDDLADLLNSLDAEVTVNTPQAEQIFGDLTAAVSEPAPAPVPEVKAVDIPVYTEPVAPAAAPEPVAPVFAPEPEKVEQPKEPVMPVFSQEPVAKSAPINTIAEGVNEVGVIPMGMTVVGDITSNGSLDIMGTVKGNVTVAGKLNITGNIEGDSKAEEVFADGARIIGEVISNGTIKVGQSSVIKGNLSASSAVLAGAVKGDIDVKGPVILDSTAIIMGNIKSKSIQINNGAAIEGLCSQCYAEVSPSSFFTEG